MPSSQLPPSSDTELLVAQLSAHHRARVRAHLLGLLESDRRLRFGYMASDDAIESYVRSLHFARDAAFGAFDPQARLVGFGHLAFDRSPGSPDAEFGISVLPEFRRRGLGLALLNRAADHARNRGATRLVMSHVPENAALVKLAQRAGMEFQEDPIESRAYLELGTASTASLMQETFSELMAALDLGFRAARAEAESPTSA
jgi:RimJ/RimL family protein N-acetyltransferase